MNRYSANIRGFRYYCKRLMVLAVLVVMATYISDILLYFKQIDDEKILAASVMKNKTFSTKVQEIKEAGISAYLMEEHSVPIVSMAFTFTNAGSAHEDEEKQGLTQLLTSLLLDGAGKYDALSFKDICEEYGIKIGFDEDVDDISGYLHTPKQNLDKALDMLVIVLQSPRFENEYLQLRKQQLKTAVKMSQENPQAVLADKFAEFIYAGHPYSRSQIEKLTTVDNIDEDDLREFMQTHFSKQNIIVGLAGDITREEASDIIRKVFAGFSDKYHGEKITRINLQLGGREHNIKRDIAQSISIFASNGTYRDSVDFYPLYLANYIFGGAGLNSRISQIIREKKGLTYGIYTALVQNDATAMLRGSYSATSDNFGKAKKLLLKEWQKMAQNGVSEQELRQAKGALIASYNLRFASISEIAEMLVGMQKYRLGSDFLEKRNNYISAVTLSETNAAAKKYFSQMPDFVNIGVEQEEKK